MALFDPKKIAGKAVVYEVAMVVRTLNAFLFNKANGCSSTPFHTTRERCANPY